MGLFLPRQEILAPIGLVTQPSQYKQYPSGALGVARNVVMRNPGELMQAPDVQAVQSVGGANNVIHKVIPLDTGHVYSVQVNGTTWSVFEITNAVTVPGSATNSFSSTGRISWARVAERLLLNGAFGNLIGDYMAPVNAAQRDLRRAGLPQPTWNGSPGFTDNGIGWFAANQMVGYVVCFVREFADGYALRSVPSVPRKLILDATFTAPPYNVSISIRWLGGIIVAGDKIELYRTDTLATTNTNSDPGATYKLVRTHTVTAAQQAAAQASFVDSQPNIQGSLVAPGEELYSNPGQEGELYTNRRPPIAKCVESFKGFAFYGHTTERAQWKFGVPGGWGPQSEALQAGISVAAFKAKGIGSRVGVGTITIGSAVITVVPAGDLVGIVPGQVFNGSNFPANTTVLSVGGASITMSANATAGGAAWAIYDVIEINGVSSSAYSPPDWIDGKTGYEITSSLNVPRSEPRFMLAFEFTVEVNDHPLNANITVRATNGANYSPPVPEINQTVATFTPLTLKNRIQWSKEQQPEHAPSASEDFVGFAELYATNATRDAVWHWCSDGLFRLSGDAGALGLGNWQVDYASSTLLLAGPQASTVLNEFLYGYTNVGFVEVDSAGNVVNLSDKIIGDLLPGQKYTESRAIVVERNETDEEVLLILGDNGAGSSSTVHVFNTKQRAWTTLGANGPSLANITALAMQRSPTSGEPRTLFGVSPLGGGSPSYAGWNNAGAFLAWECQYRAIYGDDPLEVKRWLWADYLFDLVSAGRNITPLWNGVQFGGDVDVQALDVGAYARAGCPRQVGLSQSIVVGLRGAASATQARFQGVSVPVKQRTNQSKKR